jgi:DNA-directed RNA polymerase III subunit RPC8
MFFVHRVTDTLAIPPTALAMDTKVAVEQAIDDLYPGRIWLDLGLVVSRYHPLKNFTSWDESGSDNEETNGRTRKKQRTAADDEIVVGPGVCVAGQAHVHVTATFSLVLFRPFLEEVCIGRIVGSNARGIQISIGFFDKIYVPAYWMLRPSTYEADTGLWVWTPAYDEEGEEEDEENNKKDDTIESTTDTEIIRYEMPIGSVVRFKVKALQFARITQTAKGRQATTTRTTSSEVTNDGGSGSHAVRRRSSSVGVDDHKAPPPPMKIMASLCEDGLGLVSWWEDEDEDEEKMEDPGSKREAKGGKDATTAILEEDLIDASPEMSSGSHVKAEQVKSEPPC